MAIPLHGLHGTYLTLCIPLHTLHYDIEHFQMSRCKVEKEKKEIKKKSFPSDSNLIG